MRRNPGKGSVIVLALLELNVKMAVVRRNSEISVWFLSSEKIEPTEFSSKVNSHFSSPQDLILM